MSLSFDPRANPGDVRAFKNMLLESTNILHAIDASGAYDFIIEAVLPDMSAYRSFLKPLEEPLAKLAARHEESFICQRFVRQHNEDTAVWVPTANGWQRLDCLLIDKITAEGDYMRLHSQGSSWLLHTTLCSLEQRLDPNRFFRVHRSAIVRLGFVDFLIHEGRRWIVQLHDGTSEQVSRAHVAAMMKALQCRSTTPERALPTP
ncbi:LytR/AlgR family response regulator transcription factor [Alteripontixanthobacter muriae]|uniref:LytR/AlgR family response regulator transcription factor n=1 Tax=Alteripontixanthobacter muriae TaxID=2705546 RepID=UPI001E2CA4FD|nr:LytTR family DNA-binding domain-containing protein [Alteripontixanthobacter muriae]